MFDNFSLSVNILIEDGEMTERQRLWAKSRYLRSKMRKIGPMITGSVVLRHIKCGKPNCRCTRGYPHFICQVTYKEKGKTKTVYVDKERHPQALFWSRNYKLFKKLLKEHTEVNLLLLRSDRKRKRKENEKNF